MAATLLWPFAVFANVACLVYASPQETEQSARRACKFRPLPDEVSEGFRGPDGLVHISDVFGVPAAVLARGGHFVRIADTDGGSSLGVSVQVAFAVGVTVSVELSTSDGHSHRCRQTWGAGGRNKQCLLAGLTLPGGSAQLRFFAAGVGDAAAPADGLANPTACITLRVDLGITRPSTTQRAHQCTGVPSLPPRLAKSPTWIAPASYVATTNEQEAVWSSALLTDTSVIAGPEMALLTVKVTSPSLVRPLQLVLEEVRQSDDGNRRLPTCGMRCVGGTPISYGQALRQALPLGPAYMLWLLATDPGGGRCVNFEFELRLSQFPIGQLGMQYLGPPPWLCEGLAWPKRLEQVLPGVLVSGESQDTSNNNNNAVFRAYRFALNDAFELTRPPQGLCNQQDCWTSNQGGFHTIELVVVELSVLRLTTQAATVAARPVLIAGDSQTAWKRLGSGVAAPTAEIPSAGGEFQHTIHTTLTPGSYTVLFVTEFGVGGLRPCASLRLRLELDPWAVITRGTVGQVESGPTTAGRCLVDAPATLLNGLAARVKTPLRSFADQTDRSEDFQLTLPRPCCPPRDRDAEIIARTPLRFDGVDDVSSLLLRAVITSPFVEADLRLQVYADGAPLGEPQMAPDGNGYEVVVGPLSPTGNFEIVLFHVPRLPTGPNSELCVTFSIDLATMRSAPPQKRALPELPGSPTCDVAAPLLPSEIYIVPYRPLVLEGEFLLPEKGPRTIRVVSAGAAPGASNDLVIRAVVDSVDAEVRLGVGGDGGSHFHPLAGLAEDHLFFPTALPGSERSSGTTPSIVLSTSRLPTESICPTVHLHVVAMKKSEATQCSSLASTLARLDAFLSHALSVQPVDAANSRSFVAPLPAIGVNVAAPFSVDFNTAELRFELGLEPPWLPLEVFVSDADSPGKVWAKARYNGQRLVLLAPSFPQGKYILRLRSWEGIDSSALSTLCAQATLSVALVRPSGRDTTNFRQEMLNVPELLAVLPLPSSLAPSWWQPTDGGIVTSQMYAVPAKGATTYLTVQVPCVLRVLAEPADILSARMTIEVRHLSDTIMYPTQLIGSTLISLAKTGRYEIMFVPFGSPCEGCAHQDLPFFFTVGLASAQSLDASTGTCGADMPSSLRFPDPTDLNPGRNWRRVQQFRVSRLPFITATITVSRPSVVLISAWSPFVDRYIRIGLKADVGIWVGEQRHRLSALEIELPPGEYSVNLDEPMATSFSGCVDFGIGVSISAFVPSSAAGSLDTRHHLSLGVSNAAAASGGAAWSLGLGARCDGLGAAPLPLDLFSPPGGSVGYGGPSDPSGRLQIRHKMLLTDIHDGRKKVYLRAESNIFLRFAVTSGDAASVEVVLESLSHSILPLDKVWSHGRGWSAAKHFGGGVSEGLWLSFHREHRDALLSGCAAFMLFVQVAPLSDLEAMSRCPQNDALDSGEWVRRSMAPGAPVTGGMVATPPDRGAFQEMFSVNLENTELVDIEVQFNFLLSNVDVQLLSTPPQLRLHPEFGALGSGQSPLNAHIVLQLQLPPGRHDFQLLHEPTGWRGSSSAPGGMSGSKLCFPMRLLVRHAPWRSYGIVDASSRALAVSPAVSSPVSIGTDLVIAVVQPHTAAMPLLAEQEPSSASQHGGGVVAVWDTDIIQMAIREGKGHEASPGFWALPLRFRNERPGQKSGEVWVAQAGNFAGSQWKGGPWPSAVLPPPDRWTLEQPDLRATPAPQLSLSAAQPEAQPAALPFPSGKSVPASSHVGSLTLNRNALRPRLTDPVLRGPLIKQPPLQQPEVSAHGLWWVALLIVFAIFTARKVSPEMVGRLPGLVREVGPSSIMQFSGSGSPKEMPSMVEATSWAVRRQRSDQGPSSSSDSGSSRSAPAASYGAL